MTGVSLISPEFERPYVISWTLTYRCNLSCQFCYASCSSAGLPDGWREETTMSDDEVCRVLDIIRHDAQCPSVSFTGGEPTLRPDLPELVRGAAQAGLYSHLVTAGTTLDRDGIAELQSEGLRSVQLALQGVEPEAADRIAGVEAHARKLEFAAHVTSLGLPLTLNVVLHRENLHRVGDVIAQQERVDVPLGGSIFEFGRARRPWTHVQRLLNRRRCRKRPGSARRGARCGAARAVRLHRSRRRRSDS